MNHPDFIVTPINGKTLLGVECAHCGGKMTVNRTRWMNGSIPPNWENQEHFAIHRACTYCTRLGRIPKRWRRKFEAIGTARVV